MPLTNAERQKRYRQRLMGLARSATAPILPVPVKADQDPEFGSSLRAEIARLEEEVARLNATAVQPPDDNEDAAFIELLKRCYAGGAMRLLEHNGAFDREEPADIMDIACHLVADELAKDPCTALDLIGAAEDAGERWALSRVETIVLRLTSERDAERAAARPVAVPAPASARGRKHKVAAVT